jgi:hypothetical protein
LEPANRRITLIVQYLAPPEEEPLEPEKESSNKPSAGHAEEPEKK